MPYEETENGNEIFTCSTCGYTVMLQGTGADIDCPRCIAKEYESENETVLTGSQVKEIMEQFAKGAYQMDGIKKLKQFVHEIETDLSDIEIKQTWPIWILSAEDITNIAEQFEISLEGADFDDIADTFKDDFNNSAETWDEVLAESIKDSINRKQFINEIESKQR